MKVYMFQEIEKTYEYHECYVHDRFFWEKEGREPYVGPARMEEIA
jgi:hypothetical protein